MALNKEQKEKAVAALKENFDKASTVVLSHYHGLSVDEINELRTIARDSGATVQVAKNTLARIASGDTQFKDLSDLFSGPTAITFSEDAVAAAKAVVEFANENEKLLIVGGAIDGKVLDEAGIKQLAKTPSLDESRAKLVGILQTPAQQIASVLQAPGSQVARVIGAKAAQGE